MKRFKYILLSAIAIATVSCSDDDNCLVEKDKYVYDIPETHVDGAVVGAYYTNITKADDMWTEGHVGTSSLGEYLSTDKAVLKQQLKWADEAGLDFLVIASGGNAAALIEDFDAVRRESGAKVKFVYDYNVSSLGISLDNKLTSDAKLDQLKADFTGVVAGYMSKDSYYKLPDGTPVVMVTKVNVDADKRPAYNFAEALVPLREAMAGIGISKLYIIGEMTVGWIVPSNYEDYIWNGFDALTANDWSTNVYDRYIYYYSFMDINWQRWSELCSAQGVDFVPCIHPSYDDRKYDDQNKYNYVFGADGDTSYFVNNCNVAKRNVGAQKVILINSWNNFHKGWAMEPTQENKGNFVKACYHQFREV